MEIFGLRILFYVVIFIQIPFALFADSNFKKSKSTAVEGQWVVDGKSLSFVLDNVLAYLKKGEKYDPGAIHGGKLKGLSISLERVKKTLEFVRETINEDIKKGLPSRLNDSVFIEKNFEIYHWSPDLAGAAKLAEKKPLLKGVTKEKILLTKYYVKLAEGSPKKSDTFLHALYGLPYDEASLSLEEAMLKKKQLTRFQYGKQEILKGVISDKKLAPELIWLTREGLEGALLQGTVVVKSDKEEMIFNVHRNNDIAYDRTKSPEEQQRYWYYKKVDSLLGYGKDANEKIGVLPEVTVAGDINYFGLGKLFLLKTKELGEERIRLTVLADTGGAFMDNQFQLDWLSGYYSGWSDYHSKNKHINDYCEAYILLIKE